MSLVPMRSQAPRATTDVAAALREARDYTLSLYGHLDLDRATVPLRQEINPLRWELGHLGWFQEYWCLRGGVRGATSHPSRYADADRLWNSSEVPHDSRWSLRLPDARRLLQYLQATLEATLERLEGVEVEERYFFELALYHEDMHGEAMLMTLQTLGLPAPAWLRRPVPPAVAHSHAGDDIRIPAQTIALGSARGDALHRFVFDNEKWAHDVELPAFAIARRCVTNEAFRAFVDDDGYRRPELWSRQGREFLAHAARDAPAYWRREGGEWRESRFDGGVPLDAEAPVQHVNAYEAEAWCRWAGRRLPTEAEWEAAAVYAMGGTNADFRPNLDGIAGRPIAAHEGRAPLFHMLGNVWEWTASPFVPYPGFAPDPYEDYSAPWFDTHRVLRGGSWATRERLVHPRFRNFYMPQRHDPFVGFRTCAPHA
jgi:iron(II)-dependent oxidoreductase